MNVNRQLQKAENCIGYEFENKELLTRALTHSSYANEKHIRSNERLEFLGDSVLSIIVSDYIFRRMQDVNEGDLSKFRSSLVCERALAELARRIRLSEVLFVGVGEERSGGRHRPSVLSDAFEAVLGAIYLDAGLDTARDWLLNLIEDRIEQVLDGEFSGDYKTAFQEIVQSDGRSSVSYTTIAESGSDSKHVFKVQAEINGVPICTAAGHSKKEAEQKAAQAAIRLLKNKALDSNPAIAEIAPPKPKGAAKRNAKI